MFQAGGLIFQSWPPLIRKLVAVGNTQHGTARSVNGKVRRVISKSNLYGVEFPVDRSESNRLCTVLAFLRRAAHQL